MIAPSDPWAALPRWLYCDNTAEDRTFILHTQTPRFIVEIAPTDDPAEFASKGRPLWLDDPGRDVMQIAKLMREAGEFFAQEIKE